MVLNQSGPGKKAPTPWVYILSFALTILFIVILIFSAYTAYTSGQESTNLFQQQQQQQLEQMHWQKLNRAEKLAADGRHLACIRVLAEVPVSYSLYVRVQHLNNLCYAPVAAGWLVNAEKLAAQGRFREAITQASQIQGGPLQAEAQQNIRDWSQNIIEVARNHYYSENGEISEALRIVEAVPENSPLRQSSQDLMNGWQQDWLYNQRQYQRAQLALEQYELAIATKAAQAMRQHPFWTLKQTEILLQADAAEQRFERLVQEAENLILQKQFAAAEAKMKELPNTGPWSTQKIGLKAQADARKQESWMPATVWIGAFFFLYLLLKRIL